MSGFAAGRFPDANWTLASGAEQVAASLRTLEAKVGEPRVIGPAELRGYPTTWAKRLAFGRDPRTVRIVVRLD